MTNKNSTPNQIPKSISPVPTFKYGSRTHTLLCYAKMRKTPFSVLNARSVITRYKNDQEVKTSLEVLERNGSVKRVDDLQWQVTTTGTQQVYDMIKRKGKLEV